MEMNVKVDDALVKDATQTTGIKKIEDLIHEALKALIEKNNESEEKERQLHHICLPVENLEKSTDFYCRKLGLEEKFSFEIKAAAAKSFFSINQPCQVTTLGLDCARIELLQWSDGHIPVAPAAAQHWAIALRNPESLISQLQQEGVQIREFVLQNNRKVTFCEDPDGHLVEIRVLV